MAFNKTLVRGFTQWNGGDTGYAPRGYTINYNGPSADWIASTELDTYLRERGVSQGDPVALSCTSGTTPFALGLFIEATGKLEVHLATIAVIA